MASSAIKTPAFAAKASNIQNEDNSSIYSGGEWSFKNASAVTGFHVASDGKVGIGTTSPKEKLEMTGGDNTNLRIYGRTGVLSNSISSNVYYNGSTWVRDADGGASYIALGNATGVITFATTSATSGVPAERMRIDANGNVGVAQPPSAWGGTYRALEMGNGNGWMVGASGLSQSFFTANAYYNGTAWKYKNNGWARMMVLDAGNGVTTFLGASSGSAEANLTWSEHLRIGTSGLLYSLPTYNNTSGAAVNMAIASSGEFLRSTSALKYKEDITPISFGLDTVLSMQPIEYKSKCEVDKDAEHKFIGFVADWEEANLPALVQKDGEGEVEGFSYDRLTAVLCKAIQELSAKVDAQAAEIEALKAK